MWYGQHEDTLPNLRLKKRLLPSSEVPSADSIQLSGILEGDSLQGLASPKDMLFVIIEQDGVSNPSPLTQSETTPSANIHAEFPR